MNTQNQASMQNWMEHLQSHYGQQVPGERVPNMDILDRIPHGEFASLRLGCPSCGTEFWTQFPDGMNTVTRVSEDKKSEEVMAQCPACGSEWNGRRVRFFSIGVPAGTGRKFRVQVFDSVSAQSPIEALQAVVSKDMVPVAVRNDPSFRGLQIDEISVDEHRLLQIRKKIQEATANDDPNLLAIIRKAEMAESRLLAEIERRQQQGKSFRQRRGGQPRERLGRLPTSDELVVMIRGNRSTEPKSTEVRTPSHRPQFQTTGADAGASKP